MIAVDVGNHAYSFGRYFECKPGQSVLMSGYLGSIGFGYPAAIGAWAAAPERPVFAVTGDGGFAQYMAELLTAVKYRDEHHARAAQQRAAWQDLKGAAGGRLGRVADVAAQPRLLALCRDLRCVRGRVSPMSSQLEDALMAAIAHEGPALVEVMTDPELV